MEQRLQNYTRAQHKHPKREHNDNAHAARDECVMRAYGESGDAFEHSGPASASHRALVFSAFLVLLFVVLFPSQIL